MSIAHLHVGQSQPHTSEAPILQFLGKPKRRRRRQLNEDGLQIINHKTKGNSHTQYQIRVKQGSVEWCFWTRYSLLLRLHTVLSAENHLKNPQFPQKRIFGYLDEDFVIKRRMELELYLQQLWQDKESKTFQKFLNESKSKATRFVDYNSLNKFRLDQ